MKIKMYKNVENNQTNMSSRPGVSAPSMFSQFSSDCVEWLNPDAKIPDRRLDVDQIHLSRSHSKNESAEQKENPHDARPHS